MSGVGLLEHLLVDYAVAPGVFVLDFQEVFHRDLHCAQHGAKFFKFVYVAQDIAP